MAQGNGYQAAVGPLGNFQAVFTGTLAVASAGEMVFNFYTDDGFIFGVGGGATRVSGILNNPPTGNLTPFTSLPVMGANNVPTPPSAQTIRVRFPAAGTYPYEVDYTECCGGSLVLTMTSGAVNSTGVPPTGSVTLAECRRRAWGWRWSSTAPTPSR